MAEIRRKFLEHGDLEQECEHREGGGEDPGSGDSTHEGRKGTSWT